MNVTLFSTLLHQNSRLISRFLLVTCIVLQSHHHYVNHRDGSDLMHQAITALSLYQGHGLSLPYANPDDLSKSIYTITNDWPPGYAILIGPMLIITQNYALSDLIIAIFAYCLLFFALFKISGLIGSEMNKPLFRPTLFLFWAFAYMPFKHCSVTDIMSMAFHISAIWLTIKNINRFSTSGKLSINLSLQTGLFIFLTCFFRYAYFSLCLVIPIVYIIIGFMNRSRLFYLHAITILVFTTSLIIIQFLFFSDQYFSSHASSIATNSISQITSPAFSGLLLLYGMFFNCYFPDTLLYSFLLQYIQNNFLLYLLFYSIVIVSITLLLILITWFISYVGKENNLFSKCSKKDSLSTAIFLFMATILFTIAFYLYYYFRTKIHVSDLLSFRGLGEYVGVVNRYYAPLLLSTQIIFFIVIFHSLSFNKTVRNFLSFMIVLSFIFNLSHYCYLRNKFTFFDRLSNLYTFNPPFGSINDFYKLMDFIPQEGRSVYVINQTERDKNYRAIYSTYYAWLKGAHLISFSDVRSRALHSSEPVNLLLPISKDDQLLKEKLDLCLNYNARLLCHLPNTKMDIMLIKLNSIHD